LGAFPEPYVTPPTDPISLSDAADPAVAAAVAADA